MFDSPEELLRKIRLGEDTSLEMKTVRLKGERMVEPRRDDLADELAAIANTRDAVLLLGVDDKTRNIVGIPPEQLETVERCIYEICSDSIKPPVLFHAFRMELADSTGTPRPILKIEIPRSLFIHKSPGGYFHRQGSSKREMPTELLGRLLQQRSQARLIRFEEQAVPDSGLADLDETLWRRFLTPDLGKDAPAETGESLDSLRKMKILTDDESGKTRVTVAGVLMCSKTPERWLPGAFIQAVKYRGVRRDSNYQIDARDLTGSLDRQIEAALTFVRNNMRVAARKDPSRLEIPQFSLRAVFEAVVNAVAHRDYSIHGSKIRLHLFDDRLELFSPGPLPNTVTIDSIALRQSTRNELITTLLSKCPTKDVTGRRRFLMEKRGEGVPIILHESRELSRRDPEYRLIDDTELLLTIYSAEEEEIEGGQNQQQAGPV